MNNKNILITGSSGFVGKALTIGLEKDGYMVIPFSLSSGNDVCDFRDFTPFLKCNIDIVFHLAGKTYVPESWQTPGNFFSVNTIGTNNTLEFCRKSGTRMIYISAYVYGVPHYLPIDEQHPVNPNNPYAHSKWIGELMCRFYAEHFGVPVIIIRPFNLYGLEQQEHFLIPMLIKQLKTTNKIVVKDGSPKRDFLHISDFVEACMVAMNCKGAFQIFNSGSGSSISVRELIQLIIELSGRAISWKEGQKKRKNEIMDTVASCKLVREGLWKPKVSLRKGILELLKDI